MDKAGAAPGAPGGCGMSVTPRSPGADRLALLRHAMDTLFGGRPAFRCCWTYINGVRP
jgi:hypothetical protein